MKCRSQRVLLIGLAATVAAAAPSGAATTIATRTFGRVAAPSVRQLGELRRHRRAHTGATCSGIGQYSFIGGSGGPSNPNVAAGIGSGVLSGGSNYACGIASGVGVGESNETDAIDAFVGGGSQNTSGGTDAGVLAGYGNVAGDNFAGVLAGYGNTVGGQFSAVVAGTLNVNNGKFSVIGGGSINAVMDVGSGANAFIGGGTSNVVSGQNSSVVGGYRNHAGGSLAIVGGGSRNVASGTQAVVPGGYGNVAEGRGSFAAGRGARALHNGTFVWSDQDAKPFVASTGSHQFIARASGGVTFYSSVEQSTGVSLAAGSGSWSSVSDRAVKTNVVPVDISSALDKVAALPISEWSYSAQGTGVRHMGPMAQDFRAAFGLGEDDRHITTIDEGGVALAAIKGLHAENQALRARLTRQEAEIAAVRDEIARLASKIDVRARH